MSQQPCAAPPQKTVRVKQRKPRRQRETPRDTFQVVIHCADEAEQERLYDEFRSRNLIVRLLTM
ncbi:MAG: hypothetical protein ACKVP0_11485 [Pirellulaceae bacterium]